MIDAWIAQIAEEFWQTVGLKEKFPRRLEESILWALPVSIVKTSELSVKNIDLWLRQRNLPVQINCPNRALRGCLIAYGGKGFLIVDGTDAEDEYRFTIAHETAHFLVDYLLPRQQAVKKFGDPILDVLDGRRRPDITERVDAILINTPLGVHTHLMHRHSPTFGCSSVTHKENRADQLALELLAPENEVFRRLRKKKKSSFESKLKACKRLLIKDFGLPAEIAQDYSQSFCMAAFGGRSFREWLGIQ